MASQQSKLQQNQKIIMHSKIHDLFILRNENQAELAISQYPEALFERIGFNQVVQIESIDDLVQTSKGTQSMLGKVIRLREQVLDILKYSQKYSHIKKLRLQYETENAYTFSVESSIG